MKGKWITLTLSKDHPLYVNTETLCTFSGDVTDGTRLQFEEFHVVVLEKPEEVKRLVNDAQVN